MNGKIGILRTIEILLIDALLWIFYQIKEILKIIGFI